MFILNGRYHCIILYSGQAYLSPVVVVVSDSTCHQSQHAEDYKKDVYEESILKVCRPYHTLAWPLVFQLMWVTLMIAYRQF